MAYTPADEEHFAVHVATIEQLAESEAERAESERAKLLRPDGSPTYAPAERAERVKAIEEEAAASFDRSTQRFLALAQEEREKAEAALAKLDGADGWEALTEAERQTAATRQPFVREDAERLAPAEVQRRARAALAAGDKAACYLWTRYIRPRGEAGEGGFGGVVGELEAALGMDASERHRTRLALERKIEATKSLRGRVEDGRRRVDGRRERVEAGMRRQLAGMI